MASTFEFYAPTDDAPTNLQLIGTDAAPFTVFISAGPPNANGYRTVTWNIQTTTVFDYEDPKDENKDNVYSFTFSMVYRGQTLTAAINVAITDISDGLAADSVVIEGEAPNQLFGVPISTIPDITGDGKPEIGVSILSGQGPASAYIISSEFYGSVPKGVLSVSTLAANGTKFLQTPETAPALLNRFSFRANMLSSAPRTSGGVDLLLSDAQRKKFYLFELPQTADYAALRGNVDPDAANAIVFATDPTGPQLEARLIGDVNGDGRNDIFVQYVHVPFAVPALSKFGIIFGRPVNTPADRTRNANAFDIEFEVERSGEGIPFMVVQKISDISGDGQAELVISASSPLFNTNIAATGSGGSWLIKSPILRGPTPRTVSLRFTSTDPLTFMQNHSAPNSIFEIDDLDSDGLRSISFGRLVIDGDDLNSAGVSIDLRTHPAAKESVGGTGLLTATADLDGDGIGDYVQGPLPVMGVVVRGALLNKALMAVTPPDPAIPGSPFINLDGPIPYPANTFESWRPLQLGAAGQIAFGVVKSVDVSAASTISDSAGRIILVREADIRLNVTTPSSLEGFQKGLRVR